MQKNYISRSEASRILRVSPVSVNKIAEKNQVKVHEVPGHSRLLYDRSDILKLANQAIKIAGNDSMGAGA